jgi:hypothetical protein
VPGWQYIGLVFAHDQIDLRQRLLSLQLSQGIKRVRRASPANFTIINAQALQPFKSQTAQGKSVVRRCQRAGFVPGLSGWQNPQFIQRKLSACHLRQASVGQMGRVKSPSKNTQPLGVRHQTQSCRCKKC